MPAAPAAAVEEEPTTSGSSEDDLTKEPSLTFGTWKSVTCEPVDADTFQLRTYRIAATTTRACPASRCDASAHRAIARATGRCAEEAW